MRGLYVRRSEWCRCMYIAVGRHTTFWTQPSILKHSDTCSAAYTNSDTHMKSIDKSLETYYNTLQCTDIRFHFPKWIAKCRKLPHSQCNSSYVLVCQLLCMLFMNAIQSICIKAICTQYKTPTTSYPTAVQYACLTGVFVCTINFAYSKTPSSPWRIPSF
jgi:hypothetical protein